MKARPKNSGMYVVLERVLLAGETAARLRFRKWLESSLDNAISAWAEVEVPTSSFNEPGKWKLCLFNANWGIEAVSENASRRRWW